MGIDRALSDSAGGQPQPAASAAWRPCVGSLPDVPARDGAVRPPGFSQGVAVAWLGAVDDRPQVGIDPAQVPHCGGPGVTRADPWGASAGQEVAIAPEGGGLIRSRFQAACPSVRRLPE